MGTLLPGRDVSAGTLSLTMKTTTKKTTKMPRKYRAYAKLPKGWKMEEVEDDKIEEVWAQQREALSGCTTPGRLTRSAYKSLRARSLPYPEGSK